MSWALAPIAGLAAVVLPVVVNPTIRWYDRGTISPAIRTGIEELSLASVALLFAFGILLAPRRRAHAVVTGLLTMALFPIISFIEIGLYPQSHNLIPLELIMYGMLTVPGNLGALTGVWIKRRMRH